MTWVVFDSFIITVLVVMAVGYAVALRVSRGRGSWPVYRTTLWYLGVACLGVGLIGPIASAGHTSFTAHMFVHLLVGMVGPLLLVLAAPVTVALRALPLTSARWLSRTLRSLPVRIITHPLSAVLLNAGGLWLLYTTDLYHAMHSSVPVHALVHLHLFLAGYVLTASLVGVDPAPHRASMRMRSAALILFIAAHQILAKWLYAHPPDVVGRADGELGAQLMYYGGDVVDVSLIVLLFAGWYAATRPRVTRAARWPAEHPQDRFGSPRR
ncbi:membrane protein [Pseudoclavibacter endophyticus]|nr:membrane protein [Pseudoclavibacter endophyticus]